jgi:phosphatidate cytidylyltransferase
VLVFIGLSVQAVIWQSQPSGLLAFHASIWVTSIVWLSLVPATLIGGRVESTAGLAAWGLFSPVCMYATWGALVLWWLQGGIWLVMSLLILVWIADIFAYFGGKRWGRNKLAPAISPGKTREGALAGLAGVVAWMLVTAQIDGSYAQHALARYGWAALVGISLLLGVVSIMGDLFESLLKRRAKIKDSSGLLPGHGGVYDRIDAVVAVVPIAYLIIYPDFLQ